MGFRGWLVAAALGLDLLVLGSQLETAIGRADCAERAKVEMVLCVAPPDWWLVALSAVLALGLAVVLAVVLASARRHHA